jgi:hypothetical protein
MSCSDKIFHILCIQSGHFLWDWCLNSGLYACKADSSKACILPFCNGYFEDEVSITIFLGWTSTTILPIVPCQVASIIGMSHEHLAWAFLILLLKVKLISKLSNLPIDDESGGSHLCSKTIVSSI